ncbi:UNVERIFIED_CONTAM: hypothetical protein Sradi_2619700 [Sesamum radiatum]|uniref:Uncharacterized protein n=1 Tax=Sesamum radiatum TaxID=300843 RepID=A0AAW2S5L1_SESRA
MYSYRDRDYDRERDYDKFMTEIVEEVVIEMEKEIEKEKETETGIAQEMKKIMVAKEIGRGKEKGKAGNEKDEIGSVGGGEAIQGAEVEVEIARTGMVMTVAKGLVAVLVLKGVGGGLRMHEPSRERRKRRQIKMTEQIIRILRLQNKIGSGHLLD